MEKHTVYRAADGELFSDPQECQVYEGLCARIEALGRGEAIPGVSLDSCLLEGLRAQWDRCEASCQSERTRRERERNPQPRRIPFMSESEVEEVLSRLSWHQESPAQDSPRDTGQEQAEPFSNCRAQGLKDAVEMLVRVADYLRA